jgi:imidazolonepropionase-like amidohydrolase
MSLVASLLLSVASTGSVAPPVEAGEVGGPGLAIRAAKVVTCVLEGPQVIDGGIVLIKDGKIEAVASARELEVPEGYELLDVGKRWLTPGIIDIHTHQGGVDFFRGGAADLNDMVYLANPGLRASTAVRPGELPARMGMAGGVASILFIPGSGTNFAGHGILVKTGFDTWAENLIKDPGSMKFAQWGNPESWGPGISMSFENWHSRDTFRRGIAYAKRWQDFEEGKGPEPERDIKFDLFRDVVARKCGVSVHTQMYKSVLSTLTMLVGEFDLPVYLDHSTIGGWLTGGLAQEMGVPAIVGPRSLDTTGRRMIGWARNKHEGMRGVAAGYQEMGLEMIGFNTDAPVIPLEEVQLQAAMGVRYGLDDSKTAALRGLTIIPAVTAKMGDEVGSIEVGKDADLIVTTGNPVDPRTSTEIMFLDGKRVYDAERDGRMW